MEQPLEDLTVIDCAQIYAGPLAAMWLGDFGAEVIKIEHPDGGDAMRQYGQFEEPYTWKWIARNKHSVPIDLHEPAGAAIFTDLVAEADVVIESFRPGTLESWGIGWDALREVNEDLVMVRTSGFGQDNRYSDKRGFGTLAEAMSGFAAVTGWPDKPPTLPALGLADAVAAMHSTFATMMALYWRDLAGGTGQFIDTSLVEPLFGIMGEYAVEYGAEGVVPDRNGNRSAHTAPRNTYHTKDGEWVALSGSAESIAKRVLRIVGGDELVEDPRFATMGDRLEHVEELDELIQDWMAERTREEIITVFDDAGAAIAPVYTIADIYEDEYFWERDALVTVEDPDLGEVTMPGVFPSLSETPGTIAHTGPALGEHTLPVLSRLDGITTDEIHELADEGIVTVAAEGTREDDQMDS